MAPVKLPYLNVYRARGRMVAYYRRNGALRRLLSADGTPVDPADGPALAAAWQRAHDAHEAADHKAAGAASTVKPQSIADLIARYRASPEWAEKAPATKLDYEKALRPLEADWGHLPVRGLLRKHVGPIRDRYAWRTEPVPAEGDRPATTRRVPNGRQANRVITVLSILLSYAVDPLGWRQDNPALRPRRLRTDGEGFRPWTPAEFQQFHDRSDEGWRFAGLLALLTAQRGQDQVTMAWSDYDGASIAVVQKKGRGRVKLRVPCHPALKVLLDERQAAARALNPAPLTILAQADGRPWGANQFQKAAGKAIRAAGLTGLVWHGLRGTMASWASEEGASDAAIAALLGHTQVQTTRQYSRGARQRKLAEQAVAAVVLPWGRPKDGEER